MPDQRPVNVQGDGRPFSLAKMDRPAIIRFKDVAALVEAVEMDTKARHAFVSDLRRIIGDYLGVVILSDQQASHAASLTLLTAISRTSAKLSAELCRLDQRYLIAIENARVDCCDKPTLPKIDVRSREDARTECCDKPIPENFDFLSLTRKLTRLSNAAPRARASMKSNTTGAPAKRHLDQSIEQLRIAIEQRGLAVTTSISGSRINRRQVGSPGGQLLLALFRKFNSHIDEPQIWGSLERGRKARALHGNAA